MESPRVFLLIVIMLLASTCFAWAGCAQAKPVVITRADNGKEVTVPRGAVMEVHLEQSGGTGYLWRIVDLDKTHLEVLESREVPLRHEPHLVGGPLLKIWKIRAEKRGHTDLKILLYRPWEGTEKAVESVRVRIRIR